MAGKRIARRDEGPRPVNGRIDFAGLYGAAAVMGFTPQQVNAMSPWQWAAAADGYATAHGDKKAMGMTVTEFDAASAVYDAMPDRMTD